MERQQGINFDRVNVQQTKCMKFGTDIKHDQHKRAPQHQASLTAHKHLYLSCLRGNVLWLNLGLIVGEETGLLGGAGVVGADKTRGKRRLDKEKKNKRRRERQNKRGKERTEERRGGKESEEW